MNLTNPIFGTTTAAEAAGLNPAALHRWLSGESFRLEPIDHDPGGHGRPRRWTGRSVRRLAIMAALSGFGLSPTRASRIATNAMARLDRHQLDTRTHLVVTRQGVVNVVVVTPGQDFDDVLDDTTSNDAACLIINVGRLFRCVDAKLAAAEEFTEK